MRLTVSLGAACAIAALGIAGTVVLGQAPNQAQLVTRPVAGVQFSTLPGFVIERVNPADRKDSYVMLTFDSLGRPVVSKEQDHPRVLLDADKDGVFESEKVLSDKVRNCQGLWFDGRTMYGACTDATVSPVPAATGGGGGGRGGPPPPAGVFRLADQNGDDEADTFETVTPTVGSIGEHGPHAIRRAPDGSFTFQAGNDATVVDQNLDPDTLVKGDKDAQLLPYLPNFGRSVRQGVHSGVYRWDPKASRFTVLFGGNRNAYDHAYNLAGEVFLFDSDMEWDINMPWYRAVRTVHGIPGGNLGYRDGSGKYPDYYIDSLPPVRDVGRGSPVGVEFYTSYAYPREYFDNLFEADWSRGRLLYTALTPSGATYAARADRAEFVHGEPFNITDVEVGPDGMLYFTTGGRNTAGGLWRLRYTGPAPPAPDMSGVLGIVRQPQPLSSWGWAAIEARKAAMGAAFGTGLERLARSAAADGMDRARALYEMQRHGAPPAADLLRALMKDKDAGVRAAAVYVAGVQGGLAQEAPAAQAAVAAAGLKDADALVRRRSAEALVRMGQSANKASLAPAADLFALLNDEDRFVRWAGRIAIERTPRADWQDRVLQETNVRGAAEGMLALVNTAGGGSLQPSLDRQLALMQRTTLSVEDKLRLFRVVQYTATEVKGGLTAAQREQLHGLLVNQFPARDERLNRELALMLAYAGQPQAIAEILAAVPAGDQNQPLQLHYLYALRTIDAGWTAEQKAQLADLLGRVSTWRGGAQFANFAGQMFDAVQPLFATPAEQQLLYAKAPDFAPLTPDELAAVQARAAAGRGGRGAAPAAAPAATAAPAPAASPAATAPATAPPAAAAAAPAPAPAAGRGGRGAAANPLAARRAGRVISRQEMLEEAVFQPQQNLDAAAGRAVFEASCASCHRFGAIGSDHGVAGLDLTASPLRAAKYSLLEAVMLPNRTVAPAHETTVLALKDGGTARGLVLRETAQAVTLLTPDAKTADVPKPQIASRTKEKTSLMTDALADGIGQAQLRNLAAFLTAEPAGQ